MIRTHIIKYVFDSSLFLGIVSAAANVAIALFSILIWRVYKNQLTTMGESLKETSKSNEATQKSNEMVILGRRAWLVITEVDLPHGFTPGHPWRIGARIENSGGVPGTNVTIYGAYRIIPPEAELPDEIPTKQNATGVAVVSTAHPVYGTAFPGPLSEAQLREIESGKGMLYVFCRIEYTDVLKTRGWCNACRVLRAGVWMIAPVLNDAG